MLAGISSAFIRMNYGTILVPILSLNVPFSIPFFPHKIRLPVLLLTLLHQRSYARLRSAVVLCDWQ